MQTHKMVVVDDEIAIREALCNYFPWGDLGFEVAGQFDNGKQALDFIKCHPLHVVFSDIRMPVMTGIELAKELFELKLQTKVIFLSGYADFEFAKQALIFGVKDYILKPAKYNELIEVFTRIKKELESSDINLQATAPSQDAEKIKEYNYDEEVIAIIKSYIEKNYWQANLKEASSLVCMNPSYLSNYFKQKTGQNFSDYLHTIRMQKSSELLKDIHKKIYEISDDVGFSSPKNFTRSFKQYFGLTPAEFRRGTEDGNR